MEKSILRFICVLLISLSMRLTSQTLQISVSQTSCPNQTVSASVSVPVTGAILYLWSISPPELIMTGNVAINMQVNLTFTSCGSHTLTCNAFNSINQLATTSQTINVICPGILVSPPTQTVCIGDGATLTASGASSYTWSNQLNGASINPTVLTTSVFSVTGNINNCSGTAMVQVVNLVINPSNTLACIGNTVALFATGSNYYTWTGSTFTNSILQSSISAGPGSYTVSSQSSSGMCTRSQSISLAPPINLTLSQSDFTTCVTSNIPKKSKPISFFASATGPVSYTWLPINLSIPNSPTVIVTPSVNTCYTVVASESGVVCTESAVACVSVIPQFTFAVLSKLFHNGVYQNSPQLCRFVPGSLNIINISTLAVGPPSAFSYSWSILPTFSFSSLFSPTVTCIPQLTFTFTTEISDAVGCLSSAFQGTAWVSICEFWETSLQQIQAENTLFEVFPNPAHETISIQSKGIIPNLQIELKDLLGKTVLRNKLADRSSGEVQPLDLRDLPPGIYLLQLFSNEKILAHFKILKE